MSTVSVHRLDPESYSMVVEREVADASGEIEVPFESVPLRLFYGGPGCALGVLDLAPETDDLAPETDAVPFEIHCRQPSNLLVRLISDDPALRDHAPLLLRRGDVVVPPGVLRDHLGSLGLPGTTNGQGELGLVALEPGFYNLFHGKGTSVRNLLAGHEKTAYLASVDLGANATVEIEVTVDFRRRQTDARLVMDVE